ncbi:MAG: hypothetical protein ABFD69_17015 [Candidatus Sumerlaeia bacterium]
MFSPYHKLTNCPRLERHIATLRAAGNVADDVFQNHNRYHYALIHKLKCARTSFDRLQNELTDTSPEQIVSDSGEFLYSINACIDSFFYTSGSAMDILAREVLTYFSIAMPNKVYYRTAREELTTHRPGDVLISKLADPTWKSEFSNYRNALTHEVLIAGVFSINFVMDGATQRKTIVFPLPDDPRTDPQARTFRQNKDVQLYCDRTLRRLLSLINTIYGDLCSRIQSNQSLPL